jgi:predicted transcriptional regulator
LYKRQDDEEYKTTTIRIRKECYDKLKDIAVEDHRSTNYIINKIIIAYINRETFSNITYDTSLD